MILLFEEYHYPQPILEEALVGYTHLLTTLSHNEAKVQCVGYFYSVEKDDSVFIPDYQIGQWDDISDDEDVERDLMDKVYQLVRDMQNDTCRKLLFGFYWHHYTMEILAKLIGANSADVAKTTKSRCLTKLRNAAKALLR